MLWLNVLTSRPRPSPDFLPRPLYVGREKYNLYNDVVEI